MDLNMDTNMDADMDIKLVRVVGPANPVSDKDSQVVMLEIAGDGNFHDPIVRQARELILKSGSQAMLDSFDLALSNMSKHPDK